MTQFLQKTTVNIMSDIGQGTLCSILANWITTGVAPTVACATIAPALVPAVLAIGIALQIPKILEANKDANTRKALANEINQLETQQLSISETLDQIEQSLRRADLPGYVKVDIADRVVIELVRALNDPDSALSSSLQHCLDEAYKLSSTTMQNMLVYLQDNNYRLREIEKLVGSGFFDVLAAIKSANIDEIRMAASVNDAVDAKHSIWNAHQVPVRQILAQLDAETTVVDAIQISPDAPRLLYGPPRIGKTCWTFQLAASWIRESSNSEAFLLNAAHQSPDDARILALGAALGGSILYVIDDIHFAGGRMRSWAAVIDDISRSHPQSVSVLWVSRTPEASPLLRSGDLGPPEPFEYPTEAVVHRYLWHIDGWSPPDGLVAGLVAKFDPRTAEHLHVPPDRSDQAVYMSEVRNAVEKAESNSIDQALNHVSFVETRATPERRNAYLLLLPAASLGLRLPVQMYDAISKGQFQSAIGDLINTGLATREHQGGAALIGLSEHPF